MKKFLILIMSGIILSQNVYCASLGKEIASVQQDQKVQNLEEGANKVSVDQVLLNQQLMDIPGGVLEVKGQKLYPLRWFVNQMGGTVTWDAKERTAIVENPSYQEAHLYLSYINGLLNGEDEQYPLPQRVKALDIPDYPLKGNTGAMLHEVPVGITIDDNGFNVQFVAYDYAFKDNQLYVAPEWFNTIFLADIKPMGEGIAMTYPMQEEIEKEIAVFQETLAPITPEETLALWIRGQQVRSGALQYSSFSPELKEKVLASKRGWVTGGSSPSAGKVTIIDQKIPDVDKMIYTLEVEEMLQGKVSGTVEEQITVKKYLLEDKVYWLISEAKGELGYFTLLPDAPIA